MRRGVGLGFGGVGSLGVHRLESLAASGSVITARFFGKELEGFQGFNRVGCGISQDCESYRRVTCSESECLCRKVGRGIHCRGKNVGHMMAAWAVRVSSGEVSLVPVFRTRSLIVIPTPKLSLIATLELMPSLVPRLHRP